MTTGNAWLLSWGGSSSDGSRSGRRRGRLCVGEHWVTPALGNLRTYFSAVEIPHGREQRRDEAPSFSEWLFHLFKEAVLGKADRSCVASRFKGYSRGHGWERGSAWTRSYDGNAENKGRGARRPHQMAGKDWPLQNQNSGFLRGTFQNLWTGVVIISLSVTNVSNFLFFSVKGETMRIVKWSGIAVKRNICSAP